MSREKTSGYENTFNSTYPSGRTTPRNQVDDVMRYIKEGERERMGLEHWWLRPSDTGYIAAEAGSHRPESARVWKLSLDATVPDFPTYSTHLDGSLFTVVGDIADSADKQWQGTLLYLDGTTVRQALSRIRGMLRVDGQLRLGPIRVPYAGTTIGGYTIKDELNRTGSPATASDNMTLITYGSTPMATQIGGDAADLPIKEYPIRVGEYNDAGEYVTTSLRDGLALLVGDYPNGDGVKYVFTKHGIEVYGGSEVSEDLAIKFNGVSVKDHDHSGGAMGAILATESLGEITTAFAWRNGSGAGKIGPAVARTLALSSNWQIIPTGFVAGDCWPSLATEPTAANYRYDISVVLKMNLAEVTTDTGEETCALAMEFGWDRWPVSTPTELPASDPGTHFDRVFTFRVLRSILSYSFHTTVFGSELTDSKLANAITFWVRPVAGAKTPSNIQIRLNVTGWRV